MTLARSGRPAASSPTTPSGCGSRRRWVTRNWPTGLVLPSGGGQHPQPAGSSMCDQVREHHAFAETGLTQHNQCPFGAFDIGPVSSRIRLISADLPISGCQRTAPPLAAARRSRTAHGTPAPGTRAGHLGRRQSRAARSRLAGPRNMVTVRHRLAQPSQRHCSQHQLRVCDTCSPKRNHA
jgi:hypothetical protein